MTEQFPGAVLDLLDAAGDRTVFEHDGREVSGRQLLGMTRRVASGLRQRGLGPGHGVALLLGVGPEAFAAVVAAYTVGARVVGVRPGMTDHQRAALVRDAEVTAAVTDRTGAADVRPEGLVLALDELLAEPDDGLRPRVPARPHDVARLIHTSGSTGVPKACVQTYAAMTAAWTLRPEDWPPAVRELAGRLGRFLVFGTLASQVMLEYGLLALAAGGVLVSADPPDLPGALVRHRATASVVTVGRLNRLVTGLRAAPADLGALRALMVSGSPLEPGRAEEAAQVLGPVVFHGYGQTETGMISMATPADPPGSLGVPPVDLEVRGPSGRPVPAGTEGEIFVRTPSQGAGYWGRPGLSSEVFVDGWVRTRDLGSLDAQGRLWLSGRTRDVVIVDANVYYTGPVERLLARHPAVSEAYVVAAPDDATGETVHAFVVPAAGRVPALDELRALVTARLGAACAPTRLTLVDEVPLTAAGKPDKRRLTRGS
ncbi:class I adenylate-forming enzyme family protein [Streptomyces ardesiacus]|uniref:class I adenylate-forming enzyme family protein n=1 Tax=Streptomyces ardesiacus TaxID=285564 RepID=UPI00201F215E|nr:class I adenylate-forming enzyme family protein [Streptomyces ardesiacus]MCL7368453.1 acyl--CoA ligase [Streptomyces ardesiacus]